MYDMREYSEIVVHEVARARRGRKGFPLIILYGVSAVFTSCLIVGSALAIATFQQEIHFGAPFSRTGIITVLGWMMWSFTAICVFVLPRLIQSAMKDLGDREARATRNRYLGLLPDHEFMEVAPEVFAETGDRNLYEAIKTLRSLQRQNAALQRPESEGAGKLPPRRKIALEDE
jgi:hypothetical protein